MDKNTKEKVKYSSKIDKETLEALRDYSAQSGISISSLITQAAQEYLERISIRPIFTDAMNTVIDENHELLEELAK